mmetsp:Transcript_2528/g.4918  ORF Transcript_2528/g.4918 Transcript_2528/m.4918 type:complete len:203 (+) Transcript_2528:73-681(+)
MASLRFSLNDSSSSSPACASLTSAHSRSSLSADAARMYDSASLGIQMSASPEAARLSTDSSRQPGSAPLTRSWYGAQVPSSQSDSRKYRPTTVQRTHSSCATRPSTTSSSSNLKLARTISSTSAGAQMALGCSPSLYSESSNTWYGAVGSSAAQLGSRYWCATTVPRTQPSSPTKHCTGVPTGKRSGGALPAAARSCHEVTA